MLKFISISEIIIAITLTISILIQNRGAGLSSAFGGDFGGYHSKRGFEKFLVFFSSFLAIIFVILAVISLILGNKTF
jgi:preprotein translocase subunit SecG